MSEDRLIWFKNLKYEITIMNSIVGLQYRILSLIDSVKSHTKSIKSIFLVCLEPLTIPIVISLFNVQTNVRTPQYYEEYSYINLKLLNYYIR